MGSNLSPEDKTFFEELLKKAEPYGDDDPIVRTFDAVSYTHLTLPTICSV